MVSADIPAPGFTIFTIAKPIKIATKVVPTYIIMVFAPIFLILEISFKSEIPLIKEASIKGTAINFKRLIKIVPKGLIQSVTKPFPPAMEFIKNPKTIPRTIPIKIFQCSANFFIKLFKILRN